MHLLTENKSLSHMKKTFFFRISFSWNSYFFHVWSRVKKKIFMRISFFLNVRNQVIFFSWETFSSYVQPSKKKKIDLTKWITRNKNSHSSITSWIASRNFKRKEESLRQRVVLPFFIRSQQVTLDDVGGEPQAWISTIIQHDNNL